MTRLVGRGRLSPGCGTIAGSGFDLYLAGMQKIRNGLFPAWNVFVADGLLGRIVFAVVLACGFFDSAADEQRFFFEFSMAVVATAF